MSTIIKKLNQIVQNKMKKGHKYQMKTQKTQNLFRLKMKQNYTKKMKLKQLKQKNLEKYWKEKENQKQTQTQNN